MVTLLDTNFTFPEAKATAVSAITSALIDPNPPVALVLMKLSSTTSSRSVIWRNKESLAVFKHTDGLIFNEETLKGVQEAETPCFPPDFQSSSLRDL